MKSNVSCGNACIRLLALAGHSITRSIPRKGPSPSVETPAAGVAVVRLDEIGDFVLFHNFLRFIALSPKYAGDEITFIGNKVYQELAEFLLRGCVSHFVWVDVPAFHGNARYRSQVGRQLALKRFKSLLCPVYSREYFGHDRLCDMMVADEKIAWRGDGFRAGKIEKWAGNRFYTRLIESPPETVFEFTRNKMFFETVLEMPIPVRAPVIPVSVPRSATKAVVFIGGGAGFRKWSTGNYARLCDFLVGEFGMEVCLVGGKNDSPLADALLSACPSPIENLVGKTSLLDVVTLLEGCHLLVGNESSLPHLAVALSVPRIVVISNGNHYGRFTPYPPEMCENYRAVFPEEIEARRRFPSELAEAYAKGSALDINDVSLDTVKHVIRDFLGNSPLRLATNHP